MPEREITTLEKKRSRRITLNMPIKERVATTLMIFATMKTYGVSKLVKKSYAIPTLRVS